MRAAGVFWGILLAATGAGAALSAPPDPGHGAAPAGREVRFERDIRPILAANCFACHGPDPGTRQGGLRLDRKEDLFAKRPLGPTVLPGKPEGSRLWARVAAEGARQMPPPASGKSLTAAQKELLQRWIRQGAPYEQHWAFVAPRRPAVPAVPAEWTSGRKDERTKGRRNPSTRPLIHSSTLPRSPRDWVRNPIDAFVLQRLEREGLRPSPEADRTTLLRRLSLDLVGLPPTPEEVDAFLADRRPDAYERQVERLLASPHYGERWGRHWLDAARYADSDGFEKDKPRSVWAYRDWVIGALNRDLPYDQFVIQQIAGDLLAKEMGKRGGQEMGKWGNGEMLPKNSPIVSSFPHFSISSEGRFPISSQDLTVATGFLRNSMNNEEGGVDPEQFRMEAMFDRMDAIGKSVLGLTIQCAQCHSHKFDPITHEDYYRLFAFLNNCDEANVAVYSPEGLMKRAEILRRTGEIEARLRHQTPDWEARLAAWEARARDDQPAWRVVRPELDASGGQKHMLQEDGSIVAGGYSPVKQTTDFTVRIEGDEPVTAVQLELLTDPNLPRGGPGRSVFGLCALTEFRVTAGPADGKEQAVKIAAATADVNPPERDLEPQFDDRVKKRRVTGPVSFAIDGNDTTAWGIDIGPGRSNVARKAVFVFERPVRFPKGTVLTFHLVQNHGGWNNNDNQSNNLGRFRFSVTGAERPVADPLPLAARQALAVPAAQRTPAQAAALFSAWRAAVPEWAAANAEIEALWQEHPQPATQLALQEREQARGTHLLERGDFLKPKQAIEPGVPSFLHPLPKDAPWDRLTFARWLVDPRSPTTARSLVNRVWQAYFGTGLVRTSEDFGLQSEAPTHRELLDWLAITFVDGNGEMRKWENVRSGVSGAISPFPHFPISSKPWSLKSLHRLIVTSATYRQSSRVSEELLRRDPENRLLARGARFRVEAEVVRDVALAASGLLNAKIGGPSVHPPAPEFLFLPPASYGTKVWNVASGPDRYRRAMYTFAFRSVPFPALQVFDAPNGDQSCVRRVRSNTPLQALTTLNEPLFLECARALARKTVAEGGATDAGRLTFAFRRCVARSPSAEETLTLMELLERQTARYGAGGLDPWSLAANGAEDRPALPEGVSPARLAGWTAVARVLLNLDETITRE